MNLATINESLEERARFHAVCHLERTLHDMTIKQICAMLDDEYGMHDLAEELSEFIGRIADAIHAAETNRQADIFPPA